MEALIQAITGFVAQYPVVGSILIVIGGLRVVFKPIFSVWRAYVEYTVSPSDNLILDKVEASPIYKGVAWLLDFFGSIKIAPKA